MWKPSVGGKQVIAGVVVIAALAAAAIYFTRNSQLDAAGMAAYFPDRDATVFYMDVGAIRTSGLLERIAGSTVGEELEYKTFVQQTGFDYKRDLDRVMVNSAGGVHYFLLQGRFDWPKLKAYATQQGGSCKGDEECSVRGSTPDRVVSFRLLRKNLLAMATARDESGARAVEKRSSAGLAFPVPPEPLWLNVTAQTIRSAGQMPPGAKLFAKALEPAERVLFSVGPEQERFHLTMDVSCRTAEDAAILRTQLEGLTQLLRGLIARENQKPNPKDLSGILTSGAFNRTDKHVVGKWTIERAFLESLGGS